MTVSRSNTPSQQNQNTEVTSLQTHLSRDLQTSIIVSLIYEDKQAFFDLARTNKYFYQLAVEAFEKFIAQNTSFRIEYVKLYIKSEEANEKNYVALPAALVLAEARWDTSFSYVAVHISKVFPDNILVNQINYNLRKYAQIDRCYGDENEIITQQIENTRGEEKISDRNWNEWKRNRYNYKLIPEYQSKLLIFQPLVLQRRWVGSQFYWVSSLNHLNAKWDYKNINMDFHNHYYSGAYQEDVNAGRPTIFRFPIRNILCIIDKKIVKETIAKVDSLEKGYTQLKQKIHSVPNRKVEFPQKITDQLNELKNISVLLSTSKNSLDQKKYIETINKGIQLLPGYIALFNRIEGVYHQNLNYKPNKDNPHTFLGIDALRFMLVQKIGNYFLNYLTTENLAKNQRSASPRRIQDMNKLLDFITDAKIDRVEVLSHRAKALVRNLKTGVLFFNTPFDSSELRNGIYEAIEQHERMCDKVNKGMCFSVYP